MPPTSPSAGGRHDTVHEWSCAERGHGDLTLPDLPLDSDETTPLVASISPVFDKDAPERPAPGLKDASPVAASPQRLLIPFLIYCIAMGAVAVPKLNIILALMCVQYEQTPLPQKIGGHQICSAPSIQARMGQFMMCANIISGIGCAFTSPRIGALSDKYGRKPLLAFTALGLLFGDIISVVAGWFPHRISVYWVLLEFGIGGFTGSFGATMALVQTYAADCTKQDARASIFARLHACMYLGGALGPAAGALFIRVLGHGDMLSVFYAAGLCHAAFIAFVILGLKESLPRHARSKAKKQISPPNREALSFSSKARSCLRACNILRPLRIFRPPPQASLSNARRNLPLLAGIDGVAFGIQLGLASLLVLYAESRLGWQTMDASLFVSLTSATRAIVLVFLLPLAFKFASGRFFTSRASPNAGERSTAAPDRFSILIIRVAIHFDLISHLGFAMATSTAMYTLSGVIAAAGAPVSPTIQSLMTTYVDSDRYGELLGTVSLIHALARCLIPASMQLLYSLTVGDNANTVFFVLTLFFAFTFLLSLQLR